MEGTTAARSNDARGQPGMAPINECHLDFASTSSSHEDTQGLRRVRDGIPKRLCAVALIGFWERAAFWGLTAPWQNYMQHPPRLAPEDTPGALGLGQVKATRIYCAFYVGYYVTPIFFAVVADNHLGRYKTLLICLVLYNLGCAVLTLSALPDLLEKGWGLPGLIVGMICVGLGGGGFTTIMAPFIVDQYTEDRPHIKTLASGERVVTDRALTVEYIYNLYYWLGNVGSLSWFATVSLEKHINFSYAYGLTLGFMVIALFMLVVGKKHFVRVPHEANILPKTTRILLCASRNGFRMDRSTPAYQLEHRQKKVPWSEQLVDELCRGLKACRVLLAFVAFYVCFDQMQNNLISQASQMETRSTPNDMLPAMNQVACILFVPLIQNVVYPFLHKRRIYLKPITRITIGFSFVAASMIYATLVQHAIYNAGPCYEHPQTCVSGGENRNPNHINVWIQAPLYFLIATGEIFAFVTALEYANSQAPKDMKTIVQSINLLIAGIGSACAMGLTPFAHDPYLVIFYACLASGMAITTLVFWLLFRKYDEEPAFNDAKEFDEGIELELTHNNELPVDRAPPGMVSARPQLSDASFAMSAGHDIEQEIDTTRISTSTTKSNAGKTSESVNVRVREVNEKGAKRAEEEGNPALFASKLNLESERDAKDSSRRSSIQFIDSALSASQGFSVDSTHHGDTLNASLGVSSASEYTSRKATAPLSSAADRSRSSTDGYTQGTVSLAMNAATMTLQHIISDLSNDANDIQTSHDVARTSQSARHEIEQPSHATNYCSTSTPATTTTHLRASHSSSHADETPFLRLTESRAGEGTSRPNRFLDLT